jgi:hypothetical protein
MDGTDLQPCFESTVLKRYLLNQPIFSSTITRITQILILKLHKPVCHVTGYRIKICRISVEREDP